ncbi:MAG TPA: glycosyltransferase family 4 protein [Candidatus Methylomirabilis sp.]|nr:glycosyltransferase family 4 protein [Candidatus Methylomirabilis sp.]
MKVLFLVPYTTEGGSNRFRVEQYLPHLNRHGIESMVRPFLCSSAFYDILYRPRRTPRKGWYFLVSGLNRLLDLVRSRRFDRIVVHREAFPLGPPVLEWFLSRLRIPIIYDFDDAIWQRNTSGANRPLQFLKCPGKVATIIRLSRQVIAGNGYLRDYALQHNPRVTVIPTPVDTHRFHPAARAGGGGVTLGWIGSHSSAPYLRMLDPVLPYLARQYDFRLKVVGGEYYNAHPSVSNHEWRLDREVEDLQSFDIGLMPMPDNPWTQGKCAFKALQYMAVGIPVVCSPVGMNSEVVQDGVSGLLASSEAEWIEKVSLLIENPGLREAMGRCGRAAVEERYSVKANFPKFLRVLEDAVKA